MQTDFKLYKVDMKYIRNLHNIDDKVLSVSPQAGKDNRVFIGIVIVIHRRIDGLHISSGSPIAKAFKAHSKQGVVFKPSSALLQSIRKK